MNLTLTTDSDARKNIPLVGGLWGYFPAALVGVAQHSFKSNRKHNKEAPLHWSIDKSTDHAECIARHLLDLQEMIAALERESDFGQRIKAITPLLAEADALAWRALALSQTLRMWFDGAPMPFNARLVAEGAPSQRNFLGDPIVEFGPPPRDEHDLMAWAVDMGAPADETTTVCARCVCGKFDTVICNGDCIGGAQ